MDNKTNHSITNMQAVVLRSEDTERAVIGTLLRYNEFYRQNADILVSDMFHDEYRIIFNAAKSLIDKGEAATPVTVAAVLNDGGNKGDRMEIQRMVALSDRDTFVQNVRKLSDYYKRNMARLYFLQSAEDAVKMGVSLDDTIASGQKNVMELVGNDGADGITTASMAMERIKKHALDVREGKVPPGIMTGFRAFDCNYGIHDDQLVIIAARTGVGKSSLAMNIAVNVARQGVGVAYYSLEMGVEELWARVLSADMGMRALDILHRKLADFELNRLEKVTQNFAKYPLYIDEDATVKFERLQRSIRTMHQKYGVKLFVVDYLQILKSEKTFENEAISLATMSRELKNIAKELHVAVIALSQMNRAGVKEGIISKFGLRGSGEIEEGADTVVMIDRPDADPNTKGKKFTGDFSWVADTTNKALLILNKGRSTGGSEFLMDFNPEYTLFTDSGMGMPDTTFGGDEKDVMPFEAPDNNNQQPF